MRFIVSGDMGRNRLLQVIILIYALYVSGLWLTNTLLYFHKMSLSYGSVVAYYLGSEESFLSPRSYQGLLEVSHFHLFAMGMLLLVLTHLILFIPVSARTKAWLIAVPFFSALLDEGAGWAVRFLHPLFAYAKICVFLALQASLAGLIGVAVWAAFFGSTETYRGEDE